MTSDDALLALTLGQVGHELDAGRVKPTELAAAALRRIEACSRGAFAAVDPADVLAQASAADREITNSGRRGPLHGIPVPVKDLAEVAGLPRRAGSKVLSDEPSSRDAAHVSRLRGAGAIILGATAVDEFAFTTLGLGVANPVAESLSAGGSSAGSAAAVSAGICRAATGSDTGGSARIPAACCQVVGVKPTFSLISTQGTIPLAPSLDHIGALARTTAEAAVLVEALSGRALDLVPMSPRRLRFACVGDAWLGTAVPGVRSAYDAAVDTLASSGASLTEVVLPDPDTVLAFHFPIVVGEAATWHRAHFDADSPYGPRAREALDAGDLVTEGIYHGAWTQRSEAVTAVDEALDGFVALVLPTLPTLPSAYAEEQTLLGDGRVVSQVEAMIRFTCLFNHTGQPALSLPIPADAGPVGLQLVGHRGDDARLLATARALEELFPTPVRDRPAPNATPLSPVATLATGPTAP